MTLILKTEMRLYIFLKKLYRCQVVKKVKFLNDQSIYWGNQLECEFGGDRYFGNLVGMDFIMTCTCEENGENLELLL